LLFVPTRTGIKNLQAEGFKHIVNAGEALPPTPYPLPLAANIGDVMYDIALKIKQNVNEPEVLKRFGLNSKEFILATIHRADNTDNTGNLKEIMNGLKALANSGKRVFFPVHPRTSKALETAGLSKEPPPKGLTLNPPVSYTDMLALESSARVILTDSGGVQKEGYFFNTPCAVARKQTEWVEVVEAGWTVLTGPDSKKIVDTVQTLWHKTMDKQEQPIFGNGDASTKIAKMVHQCLSST
jgi:UDP-N-acetylglucosamine 2-epimerase